MYGTVLIVDDSKLQRMILKEILKDSFQVIEAAGGQECLDIVEHSNGKIDIVLLDLVMPEIDGFEVLRKRQESAIFREIPVIVLTMSEAAEDQVTTFELGVNEFILKPVNADIAITRIYNVLKSRRRFETLKKEQEAWQIKAENDEMTGLLNKATVERMVDDILLDISERLHALLVVDIDNFKAVNDLHGHQMGDHTICAVADLLSANFRQSDIVGRIGGDEFVVLMRNVEDKDIARQKAEEIIRRMKYKRELSIPDNVTVSIGLAFSDGGETDYRTLFQKADEALYRSKKAGKARLAESGDEQQSVEDESSLSALVWSNSRNIHSTIEFISGNYVRVVDIGSKEALNAALDKENCQVSAVYVDVSARQDDGTEVWEVLKRMPKLSEIPVVAICQEGNLAQMKAAVVSDTISDLLLAPLEPELLRRRMHYHLGDNR
ncbi:MAG: diguanylate cyclase [Clostridiales bacterium]|nr:diguanylate cyclase [Clostridiales bacterium]